MATHLIAWTESQDSSVLVPMNAVRDDVVTLQGLDRFQVPSDYRAIYAAAALGISLTRAQIVAPSLEVKRQTQEVIPHERGDDVFNIEGPRIYIPKRQILLDPGENLEFQVAEDGATTRQYGLVWLKQEAALPDMPAGPIIAARATSTQTLVANTWTTCTLTLEKELASGLYQLVGFRPSSATAIAARALITGQNYRPGVPAIVGVDAVARDFDPGVLDKFNWFAMGEFDSRQIPQIQFLASAADTAESVILYVIKTA